MEKTKRSFLDDANDQHWSRRSGNRSVNIHQSTPQPVIEQLGQGYSTTQPSLRVQHVQHFHESIPLQSIPHILTDYTTGYSNDKSNDHTLMLEECQPQMEQQALRLLLQ